MSSQVETKVHDVVEEIDEDNDDSDDPKESLIQLLKTCRYTLKAFDKENGKTRKNYENPIMTALNNYLKLVQNEQSVFDDFRSDYSKLFKKYREVILSDNDSWLCNENDSVIIYIGDAKAKRSKMKRALHLSSIYQKAANLFDKYCNAPIGSDGKVHPYLLLPTRVIHHLYILFLEVAKSSVDIERLGELLEKSSGQLGITDGTYTPIDELSTLFGGGSIKDNIASLMKIMFSTAKRNGFDVPEGEFDIGKMSTLIEKIMSSKARDGIIGDIVKNLKDCKSPAEIIKVFKHLMTQPEILEEVSNITGMKIDQNDIKKVIENSEFEQKVNSLVSDGTTLFKSAKETITTHAPTIEE